MNNVTLEQYDYKENRYLKSILLSYYMYSRKNTPIRGYK